MNRRLAREPQHRGQIPHDTLPDWNWAHHIHAQLVGAWLATGIDLVVDEGTCSPTEVHQVLATLHLPSESGDLCTHPTAGVTLVPSAFLDHRPLTTLDGPEPRLLFYPARNVATLWSATPPPPPSLERLLGTSRAQLLTLLAKPYTTAGLAGLTRLAPASVSFHLGILRDAGLAQSQRVGRNVVYTATPLGRGLVTPTRMAKPIHQQVTPDQRGTVGH